MEKISFDSGVKSYKINGTGVLRFNPGDPNVYARFLQAADKLPVGGASNIIRCPSEL